jgi:hypothetical protein
MHEYRPARDARLGQVLSVPFFGRTKKSARARDGIPLVTNSTILQTKRNWISPGGVSHPQIAFERGRGPLDQSVKTTTTFTTSAPQYAADRSQKKVPGTNSSQIEFEKLCARNGCGIDAYNGNPALEFLSGRHSSPAIRQSLTPAAAAICYGAAPIHCYTPIAFITSSTENAARIMPIILVRIDAPPVPITCMIFSEKTSINQVMPKIAIVISVVPT